MNRNIIYLYICMPKLSKMAQTFTTLENII